MKVKRLRATMTEVETKSIKILFSYEMPVAFYDPLHDVIFETSKKWSRTTSRHIAEWSRLFPSAKVEVTSQEGLERIINL